MLYQQVRPKDFSDVVGNEEVIKSLQSMLAGKEEPPHAFLFSGPTGCGKTTIARILSKHLGCEEAGLIELNAANTRGIDTVRNVVSEESLPSFMSKTKVILLDESHQLTPAAQKCLLKILEDCPRRCFFILCTTNPDNLIPTIRNRCVHYTMGLLGRKKLRVVLDRASDSLGKEISSDIKDVISDVANGCARQALILLEKILDMPDEKDALLLLTKDTIYDDSIWSLCSLICSAPKVRLKKWKEMFDLVSHIEEDSEAIRRTILGSLCKRIQQSKTEEDAKDFAFLLQVFSMNTYSGGKGLLFSMISKACFGDLLLNKTAE